MSARQERATLGFLANVVIFSVAMLIYRYDFYYVDFLRDETKNLLLWLYVAYIVVGLPLALLMPASRDSKGLVVLSAVTRYMSASVRYLKDFPLRRENAPRMSSEEKTAILFLLVKFFFLPIMFNYMFQNGKSLIENWDKLSGFTATDDLLLSGWYPLLISLIFTIDTLYFAFGYTVEHASLKNTVRSVEPTLFGWMIALLCYPPFNDVPGYYVGWAADDFAKFDSIPMTYALRIAVLLCLTIYVWASVALGTRCSNLTNRGIVSRGPYAFVRHPAYISKNLAWWLTSIPFVLSTGRLWFAVLSMGTWAGIYFFRALTEERHLIADPDYQEYCRRVKWRFIPFVF